MSGSPSWSHGSTISPPRDLRRRPGGRVPEGVGQRETSGGDIRAREIEGKTDLRTSGGDAYAEKVVGELSFGDFGWGHCGEWREREHLRKVHRAGNVKIADVDGRAEAETSGGDVSLSVTGPNRGSRRRRPAETSRSPSAKTWAPGSTPGRAGGKWCAIFPSPCRQDQ